MAKFKVTETPWSVVRHPEKNHHHGGRLSIQAANELILVQHTFDGEQAESNVALMAAAPELADALMFIRKQSQDTRAEWSKETLMNTFREFAEKATEALAKAGIPSDAYML